jgi:hypothetical protein
MPFPTSYADTELAAINQILSAVGQAPVTELDQANPEISIAYDTLIKCSRECQSEGWTFNTEYNYPLHPNSNKEIPLADNMLRVELSQNTLANDGKHVVRRDGKLYETVAHTYLWKDIDTIECDIVWWFDWKDLPVPFRDYIVARASTLTALKVVGDEDQYKLLYEREALARATIVEYECNQGNYTMFGFARGDQNYVSYQPFHTLSR